jgi:hypothetical protein
MQMCVTKRVKAEKRVDQMEVEVLDSLMGYDLGNICAKAER